MPKMIQIRNAPEDLHRERKARAAKAGQSLSDFLLAELQRFAARPTGAEMFARLAQHESVTLKPSAAGIIREMSGR